MHYAISKGTIFRPEVTNPNADRAIVYAVDGTKESFDVLVERLKNHDFSANPTIYVKPPPRYQARVRGPDDELSKPVFFDDLVAFHKWKVKTLYLPNMKFTAEPIREENPVPTELKETEACPEVSGLTYMARSIYGIYCEVGIQTCTPALILDGLSRATYYLTPETMDTKKIEEICAVRDISYNRQLNLLAFDIKSPAEPEKSLDYYTLNLSFLNSFYGQHILPRLRRLKYRVIQFRINDVKTTLGGIAIMCMRAEKPLVSQFICKDTPMDHDDFLKMVGKLDPIASENGFIQVTNPVIHDQVRSRLMLPEKETDSYALAYI